MCGVTSDGVQNLFSFKAETILNYDLADVRLPGAVADPVTGSPRLAKPISSLSKSSALIPGTVTTGASSGQNTTKAPRISGLDYGTGALEGSMDVANKSRSEVQAAGNFELPLFLFLKYRHSYIQLVIVSCSSHRSSCQT